MSELKFVSIHPVVVKMFQSGVPQVMANVAKNILDFNVPDGRDSTFSVSCFYI